jgi:23S rRNA pseudouridine1911/1915/1917 synthase
MQGSALEGSSSDYNQRLDIIVTGDEGSVRLDRVLAVHSPDLSRSRLKSLILAGCVSVV